MYIIPFTCIIICIENIKTYFIANILKSCLMCIFVSVKYITELYTYYWLKLLFTCFGVYNARYTKTGVLNNT